MFVLPFFDFVDNHGFESGDIFPWTGSNANIEKADHSHAGFFSARLAGGEINSFLQQSFTLSPGFSFEFFISLAKVGIAPSPPISITVGYYDASTNFLGYGINKFIPANRLPDNNLRKWYEIFAVSAPVPSSIDHVLLLINKLPLIGSADVVVDDVSCMVVLS